MNKIQKIIAHSYFAYAYVFVVVFCIISLLFLPKGHPVIPVAVIVGVVMYILHRYRRRLLKKNH